MPNWGIHYDNQNLLERFITKNLIIVKQIAISCLRINLEVLFEIMEDKNARTNSLINSGCELLDKAFKFNELDFMGKELAKLIKL